MNEKTLHNPHLKENPFRVPDGYFEQVQARWAQKTVDEQSGRSPEVFHEKHDEGRFRRIIRLLKPQMQLAAGFVLLFGIGSLMMYITSRNQKTEAQTAEFSLMSELSYWGVDHRVVSDLILEDFPDEDNAYVLTEMDVEELIDYLNYPSLDLDEYDNYTNNE